jgi:hypothetical protein
LRSAITACIATAHSTGIDDRWKLNQQAITRGLDDTAAMLDDQFIGDGAMFA